MNQPTQAVEEFLEHHGVKGQKWGVRKAAKKVLEQAPGLERHLRNKKIEDHRDEVRKKHGLPSVKKSQPIDKADMAVKIATGALLATQILLAVGTHKIAKGA